MLIVSSCVSDNCFVKLFVPKSVPNSTQIIYKTLQIFSVSALKIKSFISSSWFRLSSWQYNRQFFSQPVDSFWILFSSFEMFQWIKTFSYKSAVSKSFSRLSISSFSFLISLSFSAFSNLKVIILSSLIRSSQFGQEKIFFFCGATNSLMELKKLLLFFIVLYNKE